jgi:hypothetical protein
MLVFLWLILVFGQPGYFVASGGLVPPKPWQRRKPVDIKCKRKLSARRETIQFLACFIMFFLFMRYFLSPLCEGFFLFLFIYSTGFASLHPRLFICHPLARIFVDNTPLTCGWITQPMAGRLRTSRLA